MKKKGRPTKAIEARLEDALGWAGKFKKIYPEILKSVIDGDTIDVACQKNKIRRRVFYLYATPKQKKEIVLAKRCTAGTWHSNRFLSGIDIEFTDNNAQDS